MTYSIRRIAAGLIVGILGASVAQAQVKPEVKVIGTMVDSLPDYVAISPNGRFMFYSESDVGDLRVYDFRTKKSNVVIPGSIWPWDLAWSPRGDQVTYARNGENNGPYNLYAMAMDPETGMPRGAPRRLSLAEASDGGAFSPDGKWIAYRMTPQRGARDLVVIPASGGPARRLVTLSNLSVPRWSADGRFIYYATRNRSASTPGYETYRVAATGGAPERIGAGGDLTPGPSPDGRFVLVRGGLIDDSLRRMEVLDPRGTAMGKLTFPRLVDGYSWLDNNRLAAWYIEWPRSVRRVDLRTGATTTLPSPSGRNLRMPRWNSDGSRFASFDWADDFGPIVIRDRDGRTVDSFNVPGVETNLEMRFSPDGRYVTARTNSSQRIALYDMQTRTLRTIVNAQFAAQQLLWRPDSKSFLYVHLSGPVTDDSTVFTIHEVTLDGRDRVLLRLTDDMRRKVANQGMELTQTDVVTVTPQGAWRVPLDGSAPTQLATGRVARGLVSLDEKHIVVGAGSTDNRYLTTLRVLSLDGGQHVDIKLPFTFVVEAGAVPTIHPDNRHVIVKSRPKDSPDAFIYMVPIDGSAPRKVGTVPGGTAGQFAVSPDGSTLLYTVDQGARGTFMEIDISKAISTLTTGGKR